MSKAVKKGSPPAGIYIKCKSKNAEELFPKFRKIFLAINRSEYEKNMHVIEISLSAGNESNKNGVILLTELAQKNGIVALIKSDIALAKETEADGVLLQSASDVAVARKLLAANTIVGLDCADDENAMQKAIDLDVDMIAVGHVGKKPPKTTLIEQLKQKTDKPILAQGKITNENCRDYVTNGAMFIDCGDYIFTHPKGPMQGTVNMLYGINMATELRKIN